MPVVEELDHDVLAAEEGDQPVEFACSGLGPAVSEGAAHGALAASGRHDPLAARLLGERFERVHRPPLLTAGELPGGDRGGQPVVARLAPGEHEQVLALGVGEAVLRAAEPERELGAEDGLQVGKALGRLGEAHDAVEAVVVGHREPVEAEPVRLFDELLGRGGTVEEAERRVRVQLGVGHDGTGRRREPFSRAVRMPLAAPCRTVAAVGDDLRRARPPPVGELLLELGPRDLGVVPAHQSYLASAHQPSPSRTSSHAHPSWSTIWNRCTRLARSASHHRSTTGQGPAQARTGDSPSAPTANRAGGVEIAPRSSMETDAPVVAHEPDGQSFAEHARRRERRQAARPRRPRNRLAGTLGRPVAPRHEHLTVGEHAAAADGRGDDPVVAEHALHPGEAVVHPLVGPAAPEPVFVVAGRVDALGHDPQPHDRRGEPRVGRAGALQLPAHPVDHVGGREPLRMQPAAARVPAPLVVELDPDARAHEPLRTHAVDELVSPHAERERELVDAVERRLELLAHLELGRRRARRDPGLLAPAGPIVREGAGRAEPPAHVGLGQCGELAERAHPEPVEQGRRAGVGHEPHGHRRDEVGGCPDRDDAHGRRTRGARRLLGRERPVGDADPDTRHTEPGHGGEQRLRRGVFAAVVARGPASPHGEGARAHDLHAGHGGLDLAHDGFEQAHVDRDVVVEHRERGGAVLRLAQLQAAGDAVAACGGRAGVDDPRLGERDRQGGVEAGLAAGREDRPVGAPEHDRAGRHVHEAGRS